MAALLARIMELPVLGSCHTELGAYAGLRSASAELEQGADMALSLFYRQCGRVLSPSPASDESLARLGIERDRIGRWGRGVDTSRFDPALRDADAYPGEIKVLYAGRLTKEKGVELLAEPSCGPASAIRGCTCCSPAAGPEEEMLRERLGDRATFLGWLDGDELAARLRERRPVPVLQPDRHLRPGDRRGRRSGLPVVAVDEGGPVVDRGATARPGGSAPPDAGQLAAASCSSPTRRPGARSSAARRSAAARARTWEAALSQLADGYDRRDSSRSEPAPHQARQSGVERPV